MPYAKTTAKTPSRGGLSSNASTGTRGMAIFPPAYGVAFVDRLSFDGTIQKLSETSNTSSTKGGIENRIGLPDQLKSGIETLSGYAMDDVKVHRNSSKPAQLQALAYTQGTDVYVGPGQEKHLPHEAWHVVQQKQGRVKPTLQMQGETMNDDSALEREADVMGAKANALQQETNPEVKSYTPSLVAETCVQRKVGFEFQVRDSGAQWKHKPSGAKRRKFFNDHNTYYTNDKYEVANDGHELEMVTVAVEEDKTGRTTLGTQMDDIDDFLKNCRGSTLLENIADHDGSLRPTSKVTNFTGVGGKARYGNIELVQVGEMSAHPQATAGMTLETMFGMMRALLETDDPLAKDDAKPNREAKIAEYAAKAHYGHGREGGREKPRGRRSVSKRKQALIDALTKVDDIEGSDALKGFLTLVTTYVYGGQSAGKVLTYAKNVTAIMSRNDLGKVYALIPDDDRQWFEDKLKTDTSWFKDNLDWPDLTADLFKHGAREGWKDTAIGYAAKVAKSKFSIESWLKGIVAGKDKKLLGSGLVGFGSLTGLGIDIGKDEKTKAKRAGIITEFRALNDRVRKDDARFLSQDEWKEFALGFFDLLVVVSQGLDPKDDWNPITED